MDVDFADFQYAGFPGAAPLKPYYDSDNASTLAPINNLNIVTSVLDNGRAPTTGNFNELFDSQVPV